MKYLKRKIDDFLKEWKQNSNRNPLFVTGAKQVGKTTSILHFAHENYENVIYINLKEEDYSDIVSSGYSVESVTRYLIYHHLDWKLIPQKTVLIFDEIEWLPQIISCLKQFKIDGRYDVICLGYLLDHHYQKIKQTSLGYQTDYVMTSFDFEEFLWANDLRQLSDDLFTRMKQCLPLTSSEFNTLFKTFKTYCSLGGLPQVISQYLDTNSYEGINEQQKEIVNLYYQEMEIEGEKGQRAKRKEVYESVIKQLAKENKKFQYTFLNPQARKKDYIKTLKWLEEMGMIVRSYNLDMVTLPLEGFMNHECFKVYLSDTGLFLSQLERETITDFLARHQYHIAGGGFRENVVAEAFYKAGISLCYYKKNASTLTMEFFLRSQNQIVPIEVKTKSGNLKSLKELITSDHYPSIKCGIRLVETDNISLDHNIYTFPLFCAFLVPKFVNSLE